MLVHKSCIDYHYSQKLQKMDTSCSKYEVCPAWIDRVCWVYVSCAAGRRQSSEDFPLGRQLLELDFSLSSRWSSTCCSSSSASSSSSTTSSPSPSTGWSSSPGRRGEVAPQNSCQCQCPSQPCWLAHLGVMSWRRNQKHQTQSQLKCCHAKLNWNI